MDSGVRLACEGAEVLEDLRELVGKGVEILAYGTCLDYFGKNEMNGWESFEPARDIEFPGSCRSVD
jgi:hypothetical protein